MSAYIEGISIWKDFKEIKLFFLMLTLFRMGLFGAAHGRGGGAKRPSLTQNLPHISYNDETWHNTPYLKKIQKIYKSRDILL